MRIHFLVAFCFFVQVGFALGEWQSFIAIRISWVLLAGSARREKALRAPRLCPSPCPAQVGIEKGFNYSRRGYAAVPACLPITAKAPGPC